MNERNNYDKNIGKIIKIEPSLRSKLHYYEIYRKIMKVDHELHGWYIYNGNRKYFCCCLRSSGNWDERQKQIRNHTFHSAVIDNDRDQCIDAIEYLSDLFNYFDQFNVHDSQKNVILTAQLFVIIKKILKQADWNSQTRPSLHAMMTKFQTNRIGTK